MRPDVADLALAPGVRLLWRSPSSIHLELGARAVVVEGLPERLVRRLANSAPPPPSEPAPSRERNDTTSDPLDDSARHALTALADAGYLWRRPRQPDDPRLVPPHPRLAGALAVLGVQHGERAAEVLSARRHASVEISGNSPLAAHLAAVLAAAGVGRVHLSLEGTVRLGHAVPGGAAVTDEGRPLSAAAEDALARAAPEVDATPLAVDQRADLTILTTDAPIADERLAVLHAADAPHLAVTLGLECGVIGPLVLPGLTSCVHCADLHRHDRDPAWPALAVQLTVGRRHGPATDVALATIVAGVAAQQALTFLDGGEPACLEGTLELRPPDWRLRRRSWPPHPACPCVRDTGPSGERIPAGSAE